jgi:hypothetical protein
MKHYKQFRAALLVSIQERRDQYPEMTDADVVRALRTVVDEIANAAWRCEQRRRSQHVKLPSDAEIAEVLRRYRATLPSAEMEKERRLHAKMRRDIIKVGSKKLPIPTREDIVRAGYRALAQKHHPDTGGSTEQMVRLNRARDKLLRG